jgi:hypothetical protein
MVGDVVIKLAGTRVDHCNTRTDYEMISHIYTPATCGECVRLATTALEIALHDWLVEHDCTLRIPPDGSLGRLLLAAIHPEIADED